MRLPRRTVLHWGACAAALPLASSRHARGQSYPTRPVRVIVGFPAGGAVDIAARLIGQCLSERLGQPFVIENRPGAAGNLATEAVLRAAPDGHTLLLVGAFNAINASLYGRLSFNFMQDIAPVATINRNPLVVLVHPSNPAKSVADLIAYARTHPGKLNMASAGNGTPQHVAGELFKMMAGLDLVRIPYPGSAPALAALADGQVDLTFDTVLASLGLIRSGKLRALAVTSAAALRRFRISPRLRRIARLRSERMERTWSAARYTGRDRSDVEPRRQHVPHRPGDRIAVGRTRRGSASDVARRICQVPRRGDREMGSGYSGSRPQGGLIVRPPAAAQNRRIPVGPASLSMSRS
jgi:tripartite-type tricarboxylate transporter receptor subunit TctC